MYQIVVLYAQPVDEQAFLDHYERVHVPLVQAMPALESFEWMVCEPAEGAAPSYFVVARLAWASRAAMAASMGSPQGQEGAADLANFAAAGVTILSGETRA